MKLLAENDYGKARAALDTVTINTLFARAVIDRMVRGTVYADETENPRTFHVVHPYGMSLLFGAADNAAFNAAFRKYALNTANTRDTHEWMQAFPDRWHETLKELFAGRTIRSSESAEPIEKGIVELNTRVNFRFIESAYRDRPAAALPEGAEIRRTDRSAFREMTGSVVPSLFWNDADDFLRYGAGFSLFHRGRLAATAYSSVVFKDQLELGIETVPEFRGKGLAELVCAALIDHCLEKGYEPVWACRKENVGSYKLAKKLGFEPVRELPYYRLSR